MKIIVIGTTGTIGVEVAKALSAGKHEVVGASATVSSTISKTWPYPRHVREDFQDVDAVISCAGNAAFRPFADLTDADYALGLRSKLMDKSRLRITRITSVTGDRSTSAYPHHAALFCSDGQRWS